MNLDFLKMGILSGISKHEGIKQQRKLAYLKIISDYPNYLSNTQDQTTCIASVSGDKTTSTGSFRPLERKTGTKCKESTKIHISVKRKNISLFSDGKERIQGIRMKLYLLDTLRLSWKPADFEFAVVNRKNIPQTLLRQTIVLNYGYNLVGQSNCFRREPTEGCFRP